jgi:methyl-accepting chemotaxis protein
MWTFGRKIALGFVVSSLLLIAIGMGAYRSTISLATTSLEVAHTHQVLEHIVHVLGLMKDAETGQRGFVITGQDAFLEPYNGSLSNIPIALGALRRLTADNRAQQLHLDEIEPVVTAKLVELKRSIDVRRKDGFDAALKVVESGEGKRRMDELRHLLAKMDADERELLRQRSEDVSATSRAARAAIVIGTALSILFVSVVGFVLTRSLRGQVGSAVRHIQSSSAELQAASTQQATGSKEASTAMNEIATTIRELLASSRQIAESAQRVAVVAEQTTGAARLGDGTVVKANESISGIRRQVDQVVGHMLDLGKKSQQIGAVLDIVSELAEQTNILAINATIEAAGAGDSGKRFAVVADEIRKLADRVMGSTKEIRGLIDDVRGSVNTTVMATETGSKAVDAGARQFDEVTATFKRIAELVATTNGAAREIELSTKQQATAVEQVNAAIANVSQATRETEASSSQTLQTAGQLTAMSQDLLRLIQPQARA